MKNGIRRAEAIQDALLSVAVAMFVYFHDWAAAAGVALYAVLSVLRGWRAI